MKKTKTCVLDANKKSKTKKNEIFGRCGKRSNDGKIEKSRPAEKWRNNKFRDANRHTPTTSLKLAFDHLHFSISWRLKL
jgi:hypothetical protein